MSWAIRTLLICLLVLAVPVQGVAAATMAFCGAGHHGAGAVGHAQHPAAPEHAQHHHGGAPSAHEHHAMAAPAGDEDSASAGSVATTKFDHTDKHKCSACASCCSFGAILSAVPFVPAPVLSPTVFCTLVPSVDAFAADGPDRPPRTVHA